MNQEWYDQLRIDVCKEPQNSCFVLTRDELYYVMSQHPKPPCKACNLPKQPVSVTLAELPESEGGHCD